jgi:S-(hydroxymethyl)glutathione dehydrogenase/alcohol dehydrogenase
MPLTVEEVTLDPPGPGELLVRVEAAGICHSDLHYILGDLRCRLPAVLGHEGCAVVEATGPGVESVAVGDRVSLLWRPRCGECRNCLVGRSELCVVGRLEATSGGLVDGTSRLHIGEETAFHFLGVSCFAERCVVSARSVVLVPPSIPAAVAAIAGCAVVTGVGAVLNGIGRCAGRSIVVVGAGGVGCAAVMGAAAAGAYPIVAIDRSPSALTLAGEVGATHAINADDEDLGATVLEITGGGSDWSIEAVGRPDTLRLAFSCLRPGGAVVAVGLAAVGATFELPINELVQQEKSVIGSLYGSASPSLTLPRIFELYLAGRLPLDRLLGESYRLDDVNVAFDALTAGAAGRATLTPSP